MAKDGSQTPAPGVTRGYPPSRFFIATVFFGSIGLRMLLVPSGTPVLHPDSHVYVSEARQDLGTLLGALAGTPTWRPPGYPLFLKLCGVSETTDSASLSWALLVQAILGGAAVGLLAVTLIRDCLRPRGGRILGCILVTLFSISAWAGPWDAVILTESLSLTTCLLVLAAIVSFANRPTVPRGAGLLLCTLAFMSLRDANIPLAACVIILTGWIILFRFRAAQRSLRLASIFGSLIALFAILAQAHSATASARADWPVTNVLSHRVLSDPARFETFVNDYGLPKDTSALVGRYMWEGWRDNPRYIAWLAVNRGAYARFLMSDPGMAHQLAVRAFHFAATDITSAELIHYLDALQGAAPFRANLAAGMADLLAVPFKAINNIANPLVTWSIASALAVLAVVILIRDGRTGMIYAAATCAVLIVVQILATFFLDACEDSRHNHLAYCLAILGTWLAAIIIIDDVLVRRAESRD